MVARVHAFALVGLDGREVIVEVDVKPGLPSFIMVGLADIAVREARERVRAAISHSGFEYPQKRIVANLAPASLRKVGPGFDLPLATGVLASAETFSPDRLEGVALHGELALTGELRPVRGVLAVAEGARRQGFHTLVVPLEHAREAALVEGLRIVPATSLREVVDVLTGRRPAQPVPDRPKRLPDPVGAGIDLADVRGQRAAISALEIAAAGAHNLILHGPPGTGKTMLARRLPGVLPPLSPDEALDVTRVHSVVGLHHDDGLARERPFRAPHHTISASGLVGGASPPQPGEASLAHHGVLFLDELSEFARPALEALRQPLEDGRVTIVRGQRVVVYPTRCMLVTATNPCPCGYGSEDDRCSCRPADLARHARRLSGPLLDRIDLLVAVGRPTRLELSAPPVTSSADVRDRVAAARERQLHRYRSEPGLRTNAQLSSAQARRLAHVSAAAQEVLDAHYDLRGLSARAHLRVLRLARTIADLDARDVVVPGDIAHALAYRNDDQPGVGLAA